MRNGSAWVAAVFAGVLAFATAATAAPRNGLIAFHTETGPDGAGEGFVAVEPDGTFRARMGESPAGPDGGGADLGGEWSPDGRRFVGTRARQIETVEGRYGTVDIYVMNADGSGFKWLTSTRKVELDARWSSDGRWLVFTSHHGIDVMRANGRARRTVVDTSDRELQPDWSPNGRRIVFRRIDDNNDDLWTARQDGTDLLQVTDTPDAEISPQWSPDGEQIVYSLFSSEGGVIGSSLSEDIWLRRPDGSDPQQMTSHDALDEVPAWSPDGARIVFVSDRVGGSGPFGGGGDGDEELYTIARDGTEETMLTDLEGRDYWPSWAPAVPSARIDKRRVAVRGDRARMLVSCFGLAERDCEGRATLVRRGRILARGRFRIRKGARKVVKLPLTRAGRELVQSRTRPTPAKATARVRGERARRAVVLRRH